MLWAMFSTELRVAGESFKAVSEYLAPKREQAKGKYDEFRKRAGERAEQEKEKAKKSGDTFLNYTQDKVDGITNEVDGVGKEVEFKAGQDHDVVVGDGDAAAHAYADAVSNSVRQFGFEANQKLPVEGRY